MTTMRSAVMIFCFFLVGVLVASTEVGSKDGIGPQPLPHSTTTPSAGTTQNTETTTFLPPSTTTPTPTTTPKNTTTTPKPTTTTPKPTPPIPTPNATTTTTTTTTVPPPVTPANTTTPIPSTTPTPTVPTTVSPTTEPSKDRRFDGPSFIGGIVLSLGIMAIAFVAWKFYIARRSSENYHTL